MFSKNVVIISDTSPLIALHCAGQTGLLPKLFGHVFVPEAVAYELAGKLKNGGDYVSESEQIMKEGCLSILSVRDQTSVKHYMTVKGLHAGESEAITLAKECNADLILVDEADARSVVIQENVLDYSGSIGVIQEAYDRGYINRTDISRIADIWSKDKRVRFSSKLIQEELRDYPNKTEGRNTPIHNVLEKSSADKAGNKMKTKSSGKGGRLD